jgi:hypothetical protein
VRGGAGNHLDPDLAVELFVLDDPPDDHLRAAAAEG